MVNVLYFPLIYCFQIYSSTGDFMKLTREYIDLKSYTLNSKLRGYWTSETGGLNEVTHIWEYGI